MANTIFKILKHLYKIFLSSLYPNMCIGCREIIEEETHLCSYCEKHIEKLDSKKLCLICGNEKDDCVCNFKIFHFQNLLCVFRNEGIAKRAYYAYKFGRRMQYADYFAQKMSELVLEKYKDIKFDYICSVPTSKSSLMWRGFDHSGLLCRKMSEILDIPILENVIQCGKFHKKQHDSSLSERFKNIKGKYFYKTRINCSSVLLVDDIRTSSATLDECSRVLMFAGADKVFCVTALTTMSKSKKKDSELKNSLH